MLVAALIMGALTAYYFGLRLGVYAAAATAGALFATIVIPGMTWLVYGAIAVSMVGLVYLGPRYGKAAGVTGMRHALGWYNRAGDSVRGWFGSSKGKK
jgi:hypothetical protein